MKLRFKCVACGKGINRTVNFGKNACPNQKFHEFKQVSKWEQKSPKERHAEQASIKGIGICPRCRKKALLLPDFRKLQQ